MRPAYTDLNSIRYYFHYGVNHLSRHNDQYHHSFHNLSDLRPSGLKPRLQPRLYLIKALYPSNGSLHHSNLGQNQSRHLHGEHWLVAPLESTDIVRLVGCPNRTCYIALAGHLMASSRSVLFGFVQFLYGHYKYWYGHSLVSDWFSTAHD